MIDIDREIAICEARVDGYVNEFHESAREHYLDLLRRVKRLREIVAKSDARWNRLDKTDILLIETPERNELRSLLGLEEAKP